MANIWQILTTVGVGDTANKAGEIAKDTEELKELQHQQNAITQEGVEEAKKHNRELIELQKEQLKVAAMTNKQKLEYQKQKAEEERLQEKRYHILEDFNPYDPIVLKALNISLRNGKFSTALLQTYLNQNHNYVTKIGVWFEKFGVIGPSNDKKPRDMLIYSEEEYEEKIQSYIEKEMSNE